MIALCSRGLGSSLTIIHLGAVPEATDFLDILDDGSQARLIPVAYFRGEDFRRGAQRRSEEVTYYDGWDQTTNQSEDPNAAYGSLSLARRFHRICNLLRWEVWNVCVYPIGVR